MHPAEYDPIQFGHLERPQEDDELRCGARLDDEPCTCGPAGPKIDSVWTGQNGRRDRAVDAEESTAAVLTQDDLGYPANWPKCPVCGKPALEGHRTCGNFFCGPERG